MNFMDSMKGTLNNEFNHSVTENGAVGYRTTGKELLDMNFAVASLRSSTEKDIEDRFIRAFFEDKMSAMKWLFFARDIRGGLGERRLFRVALHRIAEDYPEYVKPTLALVPEYGRWDDLWCLLDTELVDSVTELVSRQLEDDLSNLEQNKPISLLSKWMPRQKASSHQSRKYAEILKYKLDMTERTYQHTVAQLSHYLKVVECLMSRNDWDKINYEHVPSRANLLYNKAFLRHDEERRREFLSSLERGETKINSSVLFPHDIVHKYKNCRYDAALEAMWKSLPDAVNGCENTIVVADGSGSMNCSIGSGNVTAHDVARALAIYFAERSSGQFKDNFITFSMRPQMVDLSGGKNLSEKLGIIRRYTEVANTNIEAVFDLILTTAIRKNMKQSDLPKNILIISDMEFDKCAFASSSTSYCCVRPNSRLFDIMSNRFQSAGYQLPRLVFWNVNSRTGTIPVKENDLGVALVSGFSPNIAKMVMSNQLDPYQCLLDAINVERYQPVEDALQSVL